MLDGGDRRMELERPPAGAWRVLEDFRPIASRTEVIHEVRGMPIERLGDASLQHFGDALMQYPPLAAGQPAIHRLARQGVAEREFVSGQLDCEPCMYQVF